MSQKERDAFVAGYKLAVRDASDDGLFIQNAEDEAARRYPDVPVKYEEPWRTVLREKAIADRVAPDMSFEDRLARDAANDAKAKP